MSTNKHVDVVCLLAAVGAFLLMLVYLFADAFGIQSTEKVMGYESRLFDTGSVHTLEIVMDDWDSFIESCEDEEYQVCAVVIDGESYKNVAIRAKGNTSLSNVSSMGSQRYSFKIEFDHYDSSKTYHGLDKLSLNNVIQDNTYMKDYLTYQLMAQFGVNAPLCSYVYITVNGEDWGLYLAVEGIEDAFLERNYGSNQGELYKPDSMSFGGGRGAGKDFDMDDFLEEWSEDSETEDTGTEITSQEAATSRETSESATETPDSDSTEFGDMSKAPGNMDFSSMDFGDPPDDGNFSDFNGSGGFGGMGSDDVKLQYSDDDPDSYSNIFDNAKTDISSSDETRLVQALKALSGDDPTDALDVDQVLRYFVVHNFVVNSDSYTGAMVHNYYLYEEDGKLSMIPWDYNLAFGTFQGNNASDSVNDPIDTPLSVTGSGDRPMIDWIFSSEEYTELYHEYFAQFLEETDCISIIQETAALIAPYVEKDPTKFCTTEEFEAGVAALQEFCTLRVESVQGQLSGEIPSTSEGQREDSSSLVDTGDLNISDMGTMNNGGGQMGGNPPDMPSRDSTAERMSPAAESTSETNETEAQTQADTTRTAQADPTREQTAAESMSGQASPSMPNGGGSSGEVPMKRTSEDSSSDTAIPDHPDKAALAEQSGVEASPEQMSEDVPSDGSTTDTAADSDAGEQTVSESASGTTGRGSFDADSGSPDPSQGSGSDRPQPGQWDSEMSPGGTASDKTMWFELGISLVVLALGLLVAWKFKGRRSVIG